MAEPRGGGGGGGGGGGVRLTHRLPCKRRDESGTKTWTTAPSRAARRSGTHGCCASWYAAAASCAGVTLSK